MNRRADQNTCNTCGMANHIARFCPRQLCLSCNDRGHSARDCPRQFELGVNRQPLREFPGIGASLQLLRNADEAVINGTTFRPDSNALRVQYGSHGTIVIALQDANTDAETLLNVRSIYQDGYNHAKIKIGAKYTIMDGVLSEDTDRLCWI